MINEDLNDINFQKVNIDGVNLAIGTIKNKLPTLSNDQSNALTSIEIWLYKEKKHPDDCFYSLTGSAGTGKTTLLAVLVANLKGIFRNKVCVSAPTHKARKVIAQKTGCDNSETVQGLLGLKPDVDLEGFDVNNPIFAAIAPKKIAGYKFLIVDEASMINNDLTATIKEDAVKYGVKVLFVGDYLQLPPINEIVSEALVFPVNRYELTEVIRQSNTNPLLEVLNILRNDIINNTEEYIKFLAEIPNNMKETEGYKVVQAAEFGAELTKSFKSIEYQQDKNHCRYISWTNESIQLANRFIRRQVYDTVDPIVTGELLLGYKTVLDEDNEMLILNSEDYIVKSLTIDIDPKGIKVVYAKVKPLDDDTTNGFGIKIVVPDVENYKTYLSEKNPLLEDALRRKGKFWRYYYGFRNSYMLLEDLMKPSTGWGKQAKDDTKDLDYGYGITIHKSQGSTHHTIFVDMKNINKMVEYANKFSSKLSNEQAAEKRAQARIDCKKLLYVALSRASNKVYINL